MIKLAKLSEMFQYKEALPGSAGLGWAEKSHL